MTLQELRATNQEDYENMVQNETRAIIERDKETKRPYTRAISYKEAKHVANQRIQSWLIDTDHHNILDISSPLSIAHFVATHRRAKIWATFIRQAIQIQEK
jgi:hypothetical protein